MMSDERYVRKGYKIWDTYLDREVQELNYRSQSDYMCDVLNEKESRINTLVKENEQLKQSNDRFADTVAKQVSLLIELRKENEQLKEELNNLKKDETMLYHYYTLARYGDGV